MPWYNNRYLCPDCGAFWEDAWSAMSDDECPECECENITPVSSDDLSVVVTPEANGTWSLWRSRSDADDDPCYELIGLLRPATGDELTFMPGRKADEDRVQ